MTPKNYDLTFHYFRAFAIVSVMLTHMWVGPVLAGSEDAAKLQDSLRLCLFHSATIYFVFISGYLFDFVNRRKGQFSPLRFYKSKIVNVFCPYFILSLLLLAAGWISHHWFGYDIPFINDGTPVASLWDVLRCLAYGSASLVPYWYIPFIMTVFSVGPLIFHLPTGLLQKILLPASVLPLMVPRLLVSPLRNLCFFVPIFLMGVYCARNRDACMAFIRRHLSAIRVTAVLTSLLMQRYADRERPGRFIGMLCALGVGMLVLALVSHPFWIISKIQATPTWLFYCLAMFFPLFGFFYWLTDVKGKTNWFDIIKPAGTATLTCYIIPYIWYAVQQLLHLHYPEALGSGVPGLIKSLVFSLVIVGLTGLLVKVKIKLKV